MLRRAPLLTAAAALGSTLGRAAFPGAPDCRNRTLGPDDLVAMSYHIHYTTNASDMPRFYAAFLARFRGALPPGPALCPFGPNYASNTYPHVCSLEGPYGAHPVGVAAGESPWSGPQRAFFVPAAHRAAAWGWAQRHRGETDVFLHPNTGCMFADHSARGTWVSTARDWCDLFPERCGGRACAELTAAHPCADFAAGGAMAGWCDRTCDFPATDPPVVALDFPCNMPGTGCVDDAYPSPPAPQPLSCGCAMPLADDAPEHSCGGCAPQYTPRGAAVDIAAGVRMPRVMLGTGTMPPHNDYATWRPAVERWLGAGGRGIDTAWLYHSQEAVGDAVRASGVPRGELFISTKIPGTTGYDGTVAYVREDLRQLNLSSVDLVLLHWCGNETNPDFPTVPASGCTPETIAGTWRALEDLHRNGTVRAIGVSNFCSYHLDLLLATARVRPAVAQFERHPGLYRTGLVAKCRAAGIHVQAFSPLGTPDLCPVQGESPVPLPVPGPGNWGQALQNDTRLRRVAAARGVSVSRALLRWQLEGGASVVVRSNGNVEHMRDNLAALDAAPPLTAAELEVMEGFDDGSAGGRWPLHRCWVMHACRDD